MSKYDYVRRHQEKDPSHHCHWPGCEKLVPPAQWGCRTHWYMVPKSLRERLWAAYKPGQEITKTPSAAYVTIAREIQAWIKHTYPQIEVNLKKKRKKK